MDQVLQYFLQELRNANDDLIRLSVTTALHSFLLKESSREIEEHSWSAVSDLLEILCDILKESLNLDDSDLYNTADTEKKENQNVETRTKSESCTKTDPKNRSTDSDQSDSGRISQDKHFIKKKSGLNSDTTIENLNNLMALKSIYELSKRFEFSHHLGASILKRTLFVLATFLSSEKRETGNQLFRFSRNYTKCIQKFISSKGGRITVQIVSEGTVSDSQSSNQTLEQRLQFYEPDLATYFGQIINQNDRYLSLRIIPDSVDDIDILEVLVSQQVAWGRNTDHYKDVTPKKENKVQKKKTHESKDQSGRTMVCKAVVTKVIHGNLFWVNIGDEAIQNVERINSTLKKIMVSSQCVKKKCKENDTVAVLITGEEPKSDVILRGKVLCVKPKVVSVFALDVGGVYDVDHASVFDLSPELDISVIPQQAVMTNLYDVLPTPVELTFVEIAAASLAYLSRSKRMAIRLRKMGALKWLPTLLCCGVPVIIQQAVGLATNMARLFLGNPCSDDWCNIMLSSLELLNKLIKTFFATSNTVPASKSSSPTSDKNLINAVLKLLSNLVFNNQSMKNIFYKQHGLETVLICQKKMKKEHCLQHNLHRLLNCFINDSFHFKRKALPVSLGRTNSGSVLAEICNGDADDESDESDDDSGRSPDDDDNDGGEDDKYDEWGELDETASDDGKGAEKDDSVSLARKKQETRPEFFVKGSNFPLASDPKYEMLQGLDLGFQSISSIVCGMLNSGQGGTIYVGIAKDGKVEGEKISLDLRDNLRLGIDEIMSQLVPPIMHFQVQIRFIPVVEWVEIQDAVKDAEYFVIEIVCRSMQGIVHTNKKGQCYYRTGRKTLDVNEQGIRHLIVLDQEEKYREEILSLERQLEMLTSSDGSF